MQNHTLIEEYKLLLQNNNRSQKTISNYELVLKELSDFVRGKPFKELSAKDINEFLKWKRENKIVGGWHPKKAGYLSEGSYWLYVLSLKIFYRWLYDLPRHHYPPQVAHLDVKRRKNQAIKPSEIITKEDILTALNHCTNFKEKAIISCLYESACRISEFLSWRIGDIVFDRRGAVLNVCGKTGERRIRLIESVPHLQQWLETHPQKDNEKTFVWRKDGASHNAYMYLRELLIRVFEKAKIDKPCNPHTFRHSRLTELAKYLGDAKLKVFAGWVGGSRMSGTYVHLSGADLDADLLRAAGVETEIEQKVSPLRTKKCSRCEHENSGEAMYCSACGLPFDPEKLVSTEIELEAELSAVKKQLQGLLREVREMKQAKS